MKTRKLSAHYIYSPESAFLKYGILEVADDGVICGLHDTRGIINELPGLEFYNGIIVPVFMVGDLTEAIKTIQHYPGPEAEKQKITEKFIALNSNQIKVLSNKEIAELIALLFDIQNLLSDVPLTHVLQWFTLKPANPLNEYGSFTEGKKPGVVVLDGLDLQKLRIGMDTRFRVLVKPG